MKGTVAGGKSVSASRAGYVCHTNVTELEQELNQSLFTEEVGESAERLKGRRLFNENENALTKTPATKYLAGENEKINDGSLFEFVFSLRSGEFEKLGRTLSEQAESLREGSRAALAEIWNELQVTDVKWVAGLHLNTNNPHLHILVNKTVASLIDGQPKELKTIPLQWMLERGGQSSKIAAIFEKHLEKYAGNIPPQSVVTRFKEETGKSLADFPRNLELMSDTGSGKVETILNSMSEIRHISPRWLEEMTQNGSMYISEKGSIIFVRRDIDGYATSFTGETGWRNKEDETGFFYIGNPKKARKFLLVENPREALALLELLGHRDLSEVCIASMDGKTAPQGLSRVLGERANQTPLRVIWSLGLNRDFKQEQGGYGELVNEIAHLHSGEYKLEFFNYAPKAGYGKNWQQQLYSRNVPGALEALANRSVSFANEKEIFPVNSANLSSVQIERELYDTITVVQDKDEFSIQEKVQKIEIGRYKLVSEEGAVRFKVNSIGGEPIEQDSFESEQDALEFSADAWVDFIRFRNNSSNETANTISGLKNDAEANDLPSAPSSTSYRTELAGKKLNGVPPLRSRPSDGRSGADKREAALEKAKELTRRIRSEIKVEEVAKLLGLTRVKDKERQNWVYRDSGEKFKIFITNDLFCDLFDDKRGGRGPIELVRHVKGCDFREARSFLIENFSYLKQAELEAKEAAKENAEPDATTSATTNEKGEFRMPSENRRNLGLVKTYLTRMRGISPELVEQLIKKGDIRTTNYNSVLFVHRDERGDITGANWRATEGTKRRDVAGSDLKKGWFHIGNLQTARVFVITESPIEAMSYVDLFKKQLRLDETVVIAVDGNSIPIELLKKINERGDDAELILGFNNDEGGERGRLYSLEKLGRFSLLKHQAALLSGDIEQISFNGKVSIAMPFALDWNDELQMQREESLRAADEEHIREEYETQSQHIDDAGHAIESLESVTTQAAEGEMAAESEDIQLPSEVESASNIKSASLTPEEKITEGKEAMLEVMTEAEADGEAVIEEGDNERLLLEERAAILSVGLPDLSGLKPQTAPRELNLLRRALETLPPPVEGLTDWNVSLENVRAVSPANNSTSADGVETLLPTYSVTSDKFKNYEIKLELAEEGEVWQTALVEKSGQENEKSATDLMKKAAGKNVEEIIKLLEEDAEHKGSDHQVRATGENLEKAVGLENSETSKRYENLGTKELIKWYESNSEHRKLTALQGTINKITQSHSPDGKNLFLRVELQTEKLKYFFAFGDRPVDKPADEIFAALKTGKIKTGDTLIFSGYVNRRIEKVRLADGNSERAFVPAYALELEHIARSPEPENRFVQEESLTHDENKRAEKLALAETEQIKVVAETKEREEVSQKFKIIRAEFIKRDDLRANPSHIYLFGDNLEQSGFGGQAKEMRGEPNAIGIPTKRTPSNTPAAFFSDAEFEENKKILNEVFDKLLKLPSGTTIVLPSAGLGTGLAELPTRAPKTFAYLEAKIYELETALPGAANEKAEEKNEAKQIIEFYRVQDKWGELSNFASFEFELDGRTWRTVEHYFQANKFTDFNLQEKIRLLPTAKAAAETGRDRKLPLRADWEGIKDEVMLKALRAKFTQNPVASEVLLATKDAAIAEKSPSDAYWGAGRDGNGFNRLGMLLERVRSEMVAAEINQSAQQTSVQEVSESDLTVRAAGEKTDEIQSVNRSARWKPRPVSLSELDSSKGDKRSKELQKLHFAKLHNLHTAAAGFLNRIESELGSGAQLSSVIKEFNTVLTAAGYEADHNQAKLINIAKGFAKIDSEIENNNEGDEQSESNDRNQDKPALANSNRETNTKTPRDVVRDGANQPAGGASAGVSETAKSGGRTGNEIDDDGGQLRGGVSPLSDSKSPLDNVHSSGVGGERLPEGNAGDRERRSGAKIVRTSELAPEAASSVAAETQNEANAESTEIEVQPRQTTASSINATAESARDLSPIKIPSEQLGTPEKRLAKLLHSLRLAAEIGGTEEFRARLENPPYQDLVIEKREGSLLFIEHWTTAGDNNEPYFDGGMMYSLKSGSLKLVGTAPGFDGQIRYRPGERQFANLFTKNLLEQGFEKAHIIIEKATSQEVETAIAAGEANAPALTGEAQNLAEIEELEVRFDRLLDPHNLISENLFEIKCERQKTGEKSVEYQFLRNDRELNSRQHYYSLENDNEFAGDQGGWRVLINSALRESRGARTDSQLKIDEFTFETVAANLTFDEGLDYLAEYERRGEVAVRIADARAELKALFEKTNDSFDFRLEVVEDSPERTAYNLFLQAEGAAQDFPHFRIYEPTAEQSEWKIVKSWSASPQHSLLENNFEWGEESEYRTQQAALRALAQSIRREFGINANYELPLFSSEAADFNNPQEIDRTTPLSDEQPGQIPAGEFQNFSGDEKNALVLESAENESAALQNAVVARNSTIEIQELAPVETSYDASEVEFSITPGQMEADDRPRNYRWTNAELHHGGFKTKFKRNVEAINLLRILENENRFPTRDEQETLAKFVGFGAMKGAFNIYTADAGNWSEERDQLTTLLTKDEWQAASRSVLNAHYTSPQVVDVMWQIAHRLGFRGGRAIEPAAGIGTFLGRIPDHLAQNTEFTAVELDKLTARLCGKLFPEYQIKNIGYEEHQVPDGWYDLAVGNVPFGNYTLDDKRYNKHKASIHDYFFLKSLDQVRDGGLQVLITSTFTLDKEDERIRREIAKTGKLIAAFRLPSKTFEKNAGTEVVTDIVIIQKKTAEDRLNDIARAEELSLAKARVDVLKDEVKTLSRNLAKAVDEENIERETLIRRQLGEAETDLLGAESNLKLVERVISENEPEWLKTGYLPDPDGGSPIQVNGYYVKNPHHILGRLDRTNTMYAEGGMNVTQTADFELRLAEAFNQLPINIVPARTDEVMESGIDRLIFDDSVKPGSIKIENGKIYRGQPDAATGGVILKEDEELPLKDVNKIIRMLDIRDSVRAVINADLKEESTGERGTSLRRELNQVYDRFVRDYGAISRPENLKLMKGDPDSYLLLALEDYDRTSRRAAKTAIFTEATVSGYERPAKAEDLTEAIGITLNETGKFYTPRIVELLREENEKLEAAEKRVEDEFRTGGLAYYDPATLAWEASDEYLAGNVREKLAAARLAAETEPQVYQKNIEALEAVIPADIPAEEIDVQMSSSWLETDDLRDFLAELVDGKPDDFAVKYAVKSGTWSVSYAASGYHKHKGKPSVTEIWGTQRADLLDITQHILDGRKVMIRDAIRVNGKTEYELNFEATEAANQKAKEIVAEFEDWIWTDPERRNRLARKYNDLYNSHKQVKYNGSHLTFPGLARVVDGKEYNLRPNQRSAIWRGIRTGKAEFGHEVGLGKTDIYIVTAMELKRLGLSKKPLVAVPKAVIRQTVDRAQKLYPSARVLAFDAVADKDDRKEMIARTATGEWDIVIMSHDHLDRLPMKPETRARVIRDELDELEEVIVNAAEEKRYADREQKRSVNRLVAQLEKAKARLEADLKEMLTKTKDDTLFFEETGIDTAFIDEFQKYKALKIYTTRHDVRGIPTTRSDRATNMLARSEWLQERNRGRGFFAGTGTPISNTIAELYVQQKYFQKERLEQIGLRSFDAWVSNFGRTVTKLEKTATGEYKIITRLAKFSNLPELISLCGEFMDIKLAKSVIEVARPERRDQVLSTELSDEQRLFLKQLQWRAERLPEVDPSIDNMLAISTDARKMSMDMRLVDPHAADRPDNKSSITAAKILEMHRENPHATFMVFSDIGVHENHWGFSVFGDLTEKLVEGGIPRDKIINVAKLSENKKKEGIARLKTGDAVIALGSTETLGTGVNAQDRLLATWNLDVPWLPSAVTQRDGRIWRNGNLNERVFINRVVTVGGFDENMWATVDRKQKFINQIMLSEGDPTKLGFRTFQEVDGEELSYAEIAAVASGNPLILKQLEVSREVEELRRAQKRFQTSQRRIQINTGALQNKIIEHERLAKMFDQDYQAYLESDYLLEQEAARNREKNRAAKTVYNEWREAAAGKVKAGNLTKENYEAEKQIRLGELEKNRLPENDFQITIDGEIYQNRANAAQKLRQIVPTLYYKGQPVGEYHGFKLQTNVTNVAGIRNVQLELIGPSGMNYELTYGDEGGLFQSMDAQLRKAKIYKDYNLEQAHSYQLNLDKIEREFGKEFKQKDRLAELEAELEQVEFELSLHGKTPAEKLMLLAEREGANLKTSVEIDPEAAASTISGGELAASSQPARKELDPQEWVAYAGHLSNLLVMDEEVRQTGGEMTKEIYAEEVFDSKFVAKLKDPELQKFYPQLSREAVQDERKQRALRQFVLELSYETLRQTAWEMKNSTIMAQAAALASEIGETASQTITNVKEYFEPPQNDLAEGILTDRTAPAPSFQKETARLRNLPLTDYQDRVDFTQDEKGRIFLNPEGYEFIRAAYVLSKTNEQVLDGEFVGIFNEPEAVEPLLNSINELSQEFQENNRLGALVAAIEKSAKNYGGTAIFYTHDKAILHEEFHRASFIGSAGKSLTQRHAMMPELINSPEFQTALPYLVARFEPALGNLDEQLLIKKANKPLLVEELGNECAGANGAEYGLTKEGEKRFLSLWFESYAKANGNLSEQQFQELNNESRKIRQNAYNRVYGPYRLDFESEQTVYLRQPQPRGGQALQGMEQNQSTGELNESRTSEGFTGGRDVKLMERTDDKLNAVNGKNSVSGDNTKGVKEQTILYKPASDRKSVDSAAELSSANSEQKQAASTLDALFERESENESKTNEREQKGKEIGTEEGRLDRRGDTGLDAGAGAVSSGGADPKISRKLARSSFNGNLSREETGKQEIINQPENSSIASWAKEIENAHERFDEIVASAEFKRAKKVLSRKFKTDLNAFLVEEFGAELAAGRGRELGLTGEQSRKGLRLWMDSRFSKLNENPLAESFSLEKSERVRNLAYGKISANLINQKLKEQNIDLSEFSSEDLPVELLEETAQARRDRFENPAPEKRAVNEIAPATKLLGNKRAEIAEYLQNIQKPNLNEQIRTEMAARLSASKPRQFVQLGANGANRIGQLAADKNNERFAIIDAHSRVVRLSASSEAELTEGLAKENWQEIAETYQVYSLGKNQDKFTVVNDKTRLVEFATVRRDLLDEYLSDFVEYSQNGKSSYFKVLRNEPKEAVNEINREGIADFGEAQEVTKNVVEMKSGVGKTQEEQSSLTDILLDAKEDSLNASELLGRNLTDGLKLKQLEFELANKEKYRQFINYSIELSNGTKRNINVFQLEREKHQARQEGQSPDFPADLKEVEEKLNEAQKGDFERAAHAIQTIQKTLAANDAEIALIPEKIKTNAVPRLPAGTLAKLQEEAVKRGDVNSFALLEKIHHSNDGPRTDFAASRLEALRIVNKVEMDLIEDELQNSTDEQRRIPITVQTRNGKTEINLTMAEILDKAEEQGAKASAEKAKAAESVWRPLEAQLNPFGVIQGHLSWLTNPVGTLNAQVNPVEVIKNNPAIQLIRGLHRASLHEIRAQQALSEQKRFAQAFDKRTLELQTQLEAREGLEKMLDKAIEREAELRGMDDNLPVATFNYREAKSLEKAAKTLRSGELLETYAESLEFNPKLEMVLGEKPARVAGRAIFTKAQAERDAMRAIEVDLGSSPKLNLNVSPYLTEKAVRSAGLAQTAAELWLDADPELSVKPQFSSVEIKELEVWLKEPGVLSDILKNELRSYGIGGSNLPEALNLKDAQLPVRENRENLLNYDFNPTANKNPPEEIKTLETNQLNRRTTISQLQEVSYQVYDPTKEPAREVEKKDELEKRKSKLIEDYLVQSADIELEGAAEIEASDVLAAL